MDSEELFNCSLDRAFGKIKKYWDKNGSLFPDYYQKYFKSNIYEMIEQKDIKKIDSVTRSIFSFLGILNFYYDNESQFLTFFEQYFGSDNLYNKRILGITQSYLPSLIKKMAESIEKSENSGNIKAIGPNIIMKPDDKERFESCRRAFFDRDTNGYDMLVSFSPKENAERILSSAVHEQKELILNVDGFIPDSRGLFTPSREEYLNKLYSYAKDHKDASFDADMVSYSLDDDMALVLRRK